MFEIIVATVIIKDNQVLMVKEKKDEVKGLLNFPAGHLEAGETLVAAAIRETKEETGFDAKIIALIDTQYFTHQDKNLVIFIFQGELTRNTNASMNELEYDFYDIEFIKSHPSLLRNKKMIVSALNKIDQGNNAVIKILG